MRLKLPPRASWSGMQFLDPVPGVGGNTFDLPAERLSRLGEIVRGNPGIEILSDELHWFQMPEGVTAVSVEGQQFKRGDGRYFQAPVSLAPGIIQGGCRWIGRERPIAQKTTESAAEDAVRSTQTPPAQKQTKESAARKFLTDNYSGSITPGTTDKALAREYTERTGVTISPRTIRRARAGGQ